MSITVTTPCVDCGEIIEIPFNEKVAFIQTGNKIPCPACEEQEEVEHDHQAHRANLYEKITPIR